MPAFAHSGTGLAAQQALPIVHVLLLIIADFIAIISRILLRPGIEHPPTNTIQPYTPFTKYPYVMGQGYIFAWYLPQPQPFIVTRKQTFTTI